MTERRPLRLTLAQGAFFPVPAVLGGAVEKMWYAYSRELAARGHTVTHVSRAYGEQPLEERVDGVHRRRLPGADACLNPVRYKWRDLRYSLRVRRWLNTQPRADLVITHTFWLPMLLNPRRHGAIYVHAARFPKGQYRWYGQAARVQAVSQVVADAIAAERPELKPRLSVVSNYLSHATAEKCVPRVYRSPPVIGYAGRVHPEKGLEVLFEAVATLPEPRPLLRIIGPWERMHGGGGERYHGFLRGHAEHLGLQVEWTGGIFEEASYLRVLGDLDLFVYPSQAVKGEAFGVAPLEAMGQGVPTVVSSLPCFRDFITDGETGLVFPWDGPDRVAQLARQIQRLLDDRGLYARLSRAGWVKAQEFLLPAIVSRYEEDFYATLATVDAHGRPLSG